MPGVRFVAAVQAIAVELLRQDVGEIDVEHLIGTLGHLHPRRFGGRIRAIEQAQLRAGGVLGEEREIDPGTVPGRAEWMRSAGPDTHPRSLVPATPAKRRGNSRGCGKGLAARRE